MTLLVWWLGCRGVLCEFAHVDPLGLQPGRCRFLQQLRPEMPAASLADVVLMLDRDLVADAFVELACSSTPVAWLRRPKPRRSLPLDLLTHVLA